MTQLAGRRLGRYEIQQEIGRGGMARVYRAMDTLLQRQVAIKVLAPQLSLDPEFVQRFEREARTAANLRHPGIVTIYDVGEQDGLRYIAMEFVRGRSLHTIIEERGALGLEYALAILDPLGRALDYAHSQGSVHRDVKPHNILIDIDGRVLLTDFGIAQAPDSDTDRLTRTGIFMGTPEYMSPEQAEAQRVDGRSDLYSFGIVAYEIITGRVPFSGRTPQLIVAHAQTPPPPPTSVSPHLPNELDAVLMRALAKNPLSRFASGTAMVEALRLVARRYNIPIATMEQIAALTMPRSSSAGQMTLPVDALNEPTRQGVPPMLGSVSARPGPPPRPVVVPPPSFDSAGGAGGGALPADEDEDALAPPRLGNRGLRWAIGGSLLGLLFLVLLFAVVQGTRSNAGSGETPTAGLSTLTPVGETPIAPVPESPTSTAPVEEPTAAELPTVEEPTAETAPTEPVATEPVATEPAPPPTRAPPLPTRRPTLTVTTVPVTPTLVITATVTFTPEPPPPTDTATVEPPTATFTPEPPPSAVPTDPNDPTPIIRNTPIIAQTPTSAP